MVRRPLVLSLLLLLNGLFPAMSEPSAERPAIPALYQRLAHQHAVDPHDLYQRALAHSGRSSPYRATPLPWPWTIRVCHESECETLYLAHRAQMSERLQQLVALPLSLDLYVGPLGWRWQPAELPLRAATQPRVTLKLAVAQRAQTAPAAQPSTPVAVASNSVPPALDLARAHQLTPLINQMAQHHQIEAALIHSIVAAESAYRTEARSSAGAVGLMQLMPATAERFGLAASERTDPAQNLQAGIRYLHWLIQHFNGQLPLVLAGYNAGEGAVKKYGDQIPPYPETQTYVTRVLRFYQRYGRSAL